MLLKQVNTLDDLMKMVSKQKAITSKATRELHAEMDSTAFVYKADQSLSDGTSAEITRRVHALLFKYSALPTLTEFYQHPSWEPGFSWGGGFGVASIVGSVFLNSWSEIFPEFRRVLKSVLLRVLEEQSTAQSDPDSTALIDRILPHMNFTIRDASGIELIGEAKDALIYAKVAALLQLMAHVLLAYGILETEDAESDEEGQISASLTPMGQRVFLHLRDVEVYVSEIASLYPTLAKNKLSQNNPGSALSL